MIIHQARGFLVRPGRLQVGLLGAVLIIGLAVAVGLMTSTSQVQASAYPTSEPVPYEDRPPQYFTPGPMWLTVSAPVGGTIVSSPGGISCPGTCTASFTYGTTVTLVNSDIEGYTFDHWSGACSGSAGCTLTLVDNYFTTVTANYISNIIAVTTGPGLVTSDIAGISCGLACTAPYPNNTVVTLTATPEPGIQFYGWTGDCTGTDTCTVTMTKPMHLGAWFGNPGSLELMVVNVPASGAAPPGEITSSPPGISCLNDFFHGNYGCMAFFPTNSFVTLTANPSPGKYFTYWNGDAESCGQDPFVCQVIMEGTQFAGGGFNTIPLQFISVNLGIVNVVSTGSVSSSPPGISCVNDIFHTIGCMAFFPQFSTSSYPYPTTVVTLIAGPAPDHFFVGWSDDCAAFGTNPNCVLPITTDYFVAGSFAKQSKLVLNVHKDPNFPGGTVTSDQPGDPSCIAEQQCIYRYNLLSPTTVTLTAVPDIGSVWRWRIYCEPAGHSPTCAFSIGNGETQTVDIYFFPELVLNVGNSGGSGTMEISPPDSRGVTSCPSGSTCLVTYLEPTTVFLTANQTSGSAYAWGQACAGSGQNCMLTVEPGEQFGDSFTVDLNFYASRAAMNKALDTTTSTKNTKTGTTNTNTSPTNTNTSRNTNSGLIE